MWWRTRSPMPDNILVGYYEKIDRCTMRYYLQRGLQSKIGAKTTATHKSWPQISDIERESLGYLAFLALWTIISIHKMRRSKALTIHIRVGFWKLRVHIHWGIVLRWISRLKENLMKKTIRNWCLGDRICLPQGFWRSFLNYTCGCLTKLAPPILGASRPLPGETTDQYNARQDWDDENCT